MKARSWAQGSTVSLKQKIGTTTNIAFVYSVALHVKQNLPSSCIWNNHLFKVNISDKNIPLWSRILCVVCFSIEWQVFMLKLELLAPVLILVFTVWLFRELCAWDLASGSSVIATEKLCGVELPVLCWRSMCPIESVKKEKYCWPGSLILKYFF